MLLEYASALRIAQVELPVAAVHAVVIGGVFLPDVTCLDGMEARSMFGKESLHVGHLHHAVVESRHRVIPDTGAALFHGGRNGIGINDLMRHILHELFEDALIDAGEALSVCQFADLHLHKAVMQTQCFLDMPCDDIKPLLFIGVEPVRHQVKAPRLMRQGDIPFQTGQIVGIHGTGAGGHQDMTGQSAQVNIDLTVACCLCDHGPESILRAIAHKLGIQAVALRG